MQVKINIHFIFDDVKDKKQILEVNDNTTISELLAMVNYNFADLSEYYEFSGDYTWNTTTLPYIIKNDHVIYNVEYCNTLLTDFFNTHNITDNTIRIVVGYPQAGGPGWLTVMGIWEYAYPILNDIAVLITITGGAISLFNFLKKLKKKKKTEIPQTIFDIVYSRKMWNHNELAVLLNISNDNAKSWLKLLGYIYDRKKQCYIQGKDVPIIKKKLKKIKIKDC